jgi:hypothetical protein
MDREGFHALLEKRNLDLQQIEESIALAESYEQYLLDSGTAANPASIRNFSLLLIQEGKNSYDNLLALARYGKFTENNEIYIAAVELLDGAEVQPNFYKKVGETFSERMRDEIFAGIGISPMGLPSTDKPFDMFPVLSRLVNRVDLPAVEEMLSSSLRDLPDEYFKDERANYDRCGDIDAYLQDKRRAFLQELEHHRQDGTLFFTQEINDQVIDYVREHPETEGGVRDGSLIYITKIPYNAKKYLEETDPILKRYYACHCPWVREAIKASNISLDPVFCNCSAGFSKRPLEVAFGQPLKAEVLESAIQGDFRCRFVVHLPEGVASNDQ